MKKIEYLNILQNAPEITFTYDDDMTVREYKNILLHISARLEQHMDNLLEELRRDNPDADFRFV